ncbi:Pycsar system effector family protein [Marinobacter similis]|uniref:Pycsar effector protein domain-containing protein n=1 Tax=Marinobacter similis TaxID=1420916 RepID=W5YMC2_9GAMM|nr:Pycsar system effector family protein [Marinobacter similis]AHI30190.1 hypothetical protein AU14_14830 [Marinobacter similis]
MKDDDFEDKCTFLFDVIKRYDHYIGTTNFKVGLLMSFIAAIILGLSIRIMLTEPSGSGCNYLYYLASASSLFTILLSILTAVNLLRVVFPKTKTDKNYKSMIFFGDVLATDNGADGYFKKIKEATSEQIIEDLSKQTFMVAEIVSEKFRVLKIAVNIAIYGVVPMLAVSLLLLILHGAG